MRLFQNKSSLVPWLAYGLTLAILELIFGKFFQTTHHVGHDYSFFMPALLDGYYWFLNNGIFSPPWFTPAFCAGSALYADPQSLYYSPLQFLSFIVAPLQAAHLTLLLYASLGYLGMYLLCRRRYGTSMASAILAAVLWMLNGFITHRMLIGHVTFVGVALIPLIAYFLLSQRQTWSQRGAAIIIAALLVASWVHAALGALLVPAALSVLGLLCIGVLRGLPALRLYTNAVLGALVAGALSASKLIAVASTMANIPRSQYPLMGIGSISDLLMATFASIALPSAWAQKIAWPTISNPFIYLDVHEWTLTLTPVPLLLIAAAAIMLLARRQFTSRPAFWYLHVLLLLVLLLIPLAIQFYTPGWNAILKHLPLIKSISNTFRWTVLWLPLICVAAAMSLDSLLRNKGISDRRSWIAAATACVAMSVCVYMEPREFYANQGYDPAPITQAYAKARQAGFTPKVEKLGAYVDEDNEVVIGMSNQNDFIVQGISQAFCYNPLFGYGLENFDSRDLSPGSLTKDLGGHLNMKNPVCYTFPAENQCAPGDHYKTSEREQAIRLTHYEAVSFIRPLKQRLADAVSISTLLLCLLMLVACAFHGFWARRT